MGLRASVALYLETLRNRWLLPAYLRVVNLVRSHNEDAAQTRPHNRCAHSVAQDQKPQTRKLALDVWFAGSRTAFFLVPTPEGIGLEAVTFGSGD